LKINKTIMGLFLLMVFSGIGRVSYASSCDSMSCGGYNIPFNVKTIISEGYEKIYISSYGNKKYLTLTTNHDVNQCSVLFLIENERISSTPAIGRGRSLCNVSVHDDKVVSSWRDQGKWNNDIYHINSSGGWVLLFSDSCIGCSQTKRTFFFNEKETDTILLSDGDDFTKRLPLEGQVSVERADLFKNADIDMKTKACLIKGDHVELLDMSENGDFYKIKYKTSTGKIIIYWIQSEDLSVSL